MYLLHLFGVGYPGNMTVDSISQIGQVFSGKYSNHHPYWHTRIIGLLVHIGLAVFGDVNAGVAVYSAVQSLLMALCFAFAVMTLYQMGIGRRWIVLVQLWYMSMPYHIMYSITMWKDVLFGCAVLLLVIALWRLMSETGTVWINHVLLWMGALGMALLRNNGFLALAATLAVYLIAFGMSRRDIALTMAAALCVAWVMNNPVLDRLGVAEIGIEHSLSIPIQQMARVVAYDGTITQEQMERLDRITDVQQIEHIYLSYISDPMKDSMNGAYIRENKLEFIRLWLEIGLQNPMTYLQAWIEQTKGYWDSGYEYWIWHTGVQNNGYGIASAVPQKALGALSKWYFNSLFDMAWLRPLISIGLHVWIILALGILHLLCGDRRRAFLSVPVLMIIGTLLVATPVFSEFRYAYAVFTVLPAYLMISLPLERCKN